MDPFKEVPQKIHFEDGLLPVLRESSIENILAQEDEFDAYSFPPVCSTPIQDSESSPRAKEFLASCNYFNDPSRPSAFGNFQDAAGGTKCLRKSAVSLDLGRNCTDPLHESDLNPKHATWPSYFLTKEFTSKLIIDTKRDGEDSLTANTSSSYGSGDTTIPIAIFLQGLSSGSQSPSPPIPSTSSENAYMCDNQIWATDIYDFQAPGVPYNTYLNQSGFEPKSMLDGPKAEQGSFAEIEEFAYDGPLPNVQYSSPGKAKAFETLYNYLTDTTHAPTSRLLPMIAQNYGQTYNPSPNASPRYANAQPVTTQSNTSPRYPPQPATTPSNTSPRYPLPPPQLNLTEHEMAENLRQLRNANLLKSSPRFGSVNEIPSQVMTDDEAAAANARSFGAYIMKNALPPSALKCMFCAKNGEKPNVYESHCIKDSDGNVTCPTLQKHKCEICSATGEKAHTKKHCPYNPDHKPKLSPFRCLATASTSSNLNN